MLQQISIKLGTILRGNTTQPAVQSNHGSQRKNREEDVHRKKEVKYLLRAGSLLKTANIQSQVWMGRQAQIP